MIRPNRELYQETGQPFSITIYTHNSIKVAEYIVLNPVRKGLVQNWEDYPYSWHQWIKDGGLRMGGRGRPPLRIGRFNVKDLFSVRDAIDLVEGGDPV